MRCMHAYTRTAARVEKGGSGSSAMQAQAQAHALAHALAHAHMACRRSKCLGMSMDAVGRMCK